jgi:hypothetical protein
MTTLQMLLGVLNCVPGDDPWDILLVFLVLMLCRLPILLLALGALIIWLSRFLG